MERTKVQKPKQLRGNIEVEQLLWTHEKGRKQAGNIVYQGKKVDQTFSPHCFCRWQKQWKDFFKQLITRSKSDVFFYLMCAFVCLARLFTTILRRKGKIYFIANVQLHNIFGQTAEQSTKETNYTPCCEITLNFYS
jgi:hypothetical protein